MNANIADVIATFVREEDSDLNARFDAQTEALTEARCTQPVIGKWIDANDVQTLLAALDLGDSDFADRFPALAHLTSHDRKKCIATIEVHLEGCAHCALKRSYDLELDMRIERTYRDHSSELLQLLESEDAETDEAEHHPPKAFSAHP